ncbi:hypothetical protein SAMN05428940_7186 [Streptomyces sp. 2133.1]|nr:hypothetical protein BX261_7163 [Streptomyces sp. 2321.6]SEE17134.1 hypothetical protein SAMN05428940_7186 [Streptomyces sp. 2133.1]SNC74208.1 hypothetical protein SAMN06272741_7090 [Streptomyces sp. 2114.4]
MLISSPPCDCPIDREVTTCPLSLLYPCDSRGLPRPASRRKDDIDAGPAKRQPRHQHFDFRFAASLTAEQHSPLTLQDKEVAGGSFARKQ